MEICVEHFGGKLDLSSMIINTVEERCDFHMAASPNNWGNAKAVPRGEVVPRFCLLELYLEIKMELRIYPRQSGGPTASSPSFLMLFPSRSRPRFHGLEAPHYLSGRADI